MKVVQLLEVLNVALKRREDKKIKAFVELDKVLVVLVLMMVVLQKLQYAQNMDIVNVLHINLEVLNVDLVLEMSMEEKDKKEEK